MAVQKKRTKRYRPKPVAMPLGIRPAVKFEMPGYAASLALGTDWFVEQHVYDIVSNADMTRRCAPDGHPILPVAEAMVQACAAIQERALRTGRLGVTGDELRVLKDGVGATMEYLRTVPNVAIIRAAMAATAEFDRTGTLRV